MKPGSFPTIATAVAVVIVLFALSGYQVTSAKAATRLLGRLAAVLVELDRWLPAQAEELKLEAADAPAGAVRPAGFPLPISLPASEVAEADEARLRDLIVARAGEALYEDGLAAFGETGNGGGSLSIGEPTRWTASLLSNGSHGFWQAALLLSLIALLGLTVVVHVGGGSPLLSFALGGGFAAAASGAVWLLAQAVDGAFTSTIDSEIALIVRDGAWIGLRNGLTVGGAAIALWLIAGRRGRLQPQPVLSREPTATRPPEAPTF